ncbi:hypothetical protein EVAR_65304_1 [Eumeta japonica]|uniref:Uncharacterized protein n=1 Tax=Eumeta variegata TaxID=151549 RepID=A0A4C1YWR5_EUMVA|nr:hypothetical protein EVAR_65304_1 [Eumeta japonica]
MGLPETSSERDSLAIPVHSWVSDQLISLAFRRDVTSLCMLYGLYYGKSFEELLKLIPTADFCYRFDRRKCQQHHLDNWRSITIRFMRNIVSYPVRRLSNDLPPTVFSANFTEESSRKLYSCLESR